MTVGSLWITGSLFVISACCGCNTVQERYYYRLTDGKGPANYFRTDISGWTLFSKSQYSAGWFDEDAVEDLFGEARIGGDNERHLLQQNRNSAMQTAEDLVAQARNRVATLAEKLRTADPTSADYAKIQLAHHRARRELKARQAELDTELRNLDARSDSAGLQSPNSRYDTAGKKFVLFMNSNADALTKALSKIVEEAETMDNLIRLILGDRLRKVAALEVKAELAKKVNAELADGLESNKNLLPDTPERAEQVREPLTQMLNVVLESYGSPHFKTPDEAGKWFRDIADSLRNRSK